MKKLIVGALIACALVATPANALTRRSYNRSFGQPIKVLSQWYRGYNTKSIVYTYERCLVVAVNYYAFGILVNSERTEFPCR